jgi:uncharacterized membrane protein YqaE (UPF0057 family)
MLYIVAILLPPLAVLLTGRPFMALLNLLLTLLLYVPGLIHALVIVSNHYADKRADRIVRKMREQG